MDTPASWLDGSDYDYVAKVWLDTYQLDESLSANSTVIEVQRLLDIYHDKEKVVSANLIPYAGSLFLEIYYHKKEE